MPSTNLQSNLFFLYQDLDTVHGLGDKKLLELRSLGEKVTLSTSERGGKALRATITSMEDAWNIHIATVGQYSANLFLLIFIGIIFISFHTYSKLQYSCMKCIFIAPCNNYNVSYALIHCSFFFFFH